jgi:hypothetical protein
MGAAAGYTAIALTDLPTLRADGEGDWNPVRHALGIRSFGINAYTAPRSGGAVIEEHDETHSGHEELYVVLSGRAEFTIAGDTVDAPAGTLVLVRDPALSRAAHAKRAQTTVLCIGSVPGGVYEPLEWERRTIDELSGATQ